MPFNRPTLSQLVERARDDLDARLPGADSRMRRSPLDVLARVHSGAVAGLYGYLDWASRQILPDTSDAEILARQAAIWGVSRKAAVLAVGTADVGGADGSIVGIGAELQRSDGHGYVTVSSATVSGNLATLELVSTALGVAGNAEPGQRLTFVSPVAGVQAVAIVGSGGIVTGADEEDDDSLRARLLDRIRRPPHGGAASDYRAWALEVAAVTRVWVYPGQLGPGTVSLTFVCDGREEIIPVEDDVDAVQAHVDALRPVTAALTVFAPVATPLALTIRAVPPSDAVKAAIAAEITDLLAREAEPGGTILISHIREAISLAAGEMDHEVIAPVGNVAADPGHLLVPGVITWAAA